MLAAAVKRATARPAVTGELTVRYMKPVPVETPIVGKGSLVADHGRYVDVEGRLEELGTGARAGDGAGPVLSHSVLKTARPT